MSRESKLAKNTLILSIGTFLPKLASTITLPILTGYLTQEEFGSYDLITTLVSLVLPAATLQVQTAAFRFLIEVRGNRAEEKTLITNIAAFILPASVLALIVLYLVMPGSSLVKVLICLYFFADIVVNAARQVARGLNQNLDYSISAIVSAAGKMVFAIIFVWLLRLGLVGTVLSLFAASSLSFLYLLVRIHLWNYIDMRAFNKARLVEMLRYSWPMVPNSMSGWIIRVSDRFVVTLFMGVAANAVYSVANKIPGLLNLAQTTFTMAWHENASIVSKDDDAGEYYSAMLRTMFDLMAGFFGLLISLTPLLFLILIRGDYAAAYDQMPLLFLGMFFYSMSAFLGGIYVANMETRSVGVTTTLAAACNLLVNIALISRIGLYAASISTLVSYLILAAYRIVDVQRFAHVTCDWGHVAWVLLVMVLQAVMCSFHTSRTDVINLVIGCVLFVGLNRSLMRTVFVRVRKLV